MVFNASRGRRVLIVKKLVPGGETHCGSATLRISIRMPFSTTLTVSPAAGAADRSGAVEVGHQIVAVGDTVGPYSFISLLPLLSVQMLCLKHRFHPTLQCAGCHAQHARGGGWSTARACRIGGGSDVPGNTAG